MGISMRALCIVVAFGLSTIAQADSGRLFFSATRSEIFDSVAHYQYDVQVGPGAFDVVRIHRVVRERKPYRPIRTKGEIFMMHGAQLDFEAIFLNAGTEDLDPEKSVALYLAEHEIDVWGMDFGWTLVPFDTADFSFMRNWNLERDVDHTLDAMAIARVIRWLTGQGIGRMNLLGFSYGGGVVYAAAGRESQNPRRRRHIRGIIPVDIAMKYANANEVSRQNVCALAAGIQGQLDAGVYQNDGGVTFAGIAGLAMQNPDDMSPIVPGHTNFQAALFVGANTFLLGIPTAPFWHFVGGESDGPVTVGLRYADPARWIRLLGSLPPYMPEQARFDLRASICDEEEVSIDDHLADIRVPILYVGAEGGFGTLGEFTPGLTASRDVRIHTVSLESRENRNIDFGHADIFLAEDAKDLVWETLLKWLVDHSSRARR